MSIFLKVKFGTDLGTDEIEEATLVNSEQDAFKARQAGLLAHHEFKKDEWYVASDKWYQRYRKRGGIWRYE